MSSLRSLLLASTALTLFAGAANASPVHARPREKPVLLAQTEQTSDPAVLAAQQGVEDARAMLRQAMASGGDTRAAKRTLTEALKALNDARVAAGLPPLGKDADTAGKQPPAAEAPPPAAAETAPPPAETAPPAAAEAPSPPAEQPPPAAAETPPPHAKKPPPVAAETPPAPAEQPPPVAAEQLPADQTPAVETEPPSVRKPFKKQKKPPVQVENPTDQPPAAVTDTSPTEVAPSKKTRPPEFSVEGKPPARTGADVKEGQEVKANDGRVISKEGGELTIKSDDDSRFKREGKVSVEETRDGGSISTVKRPNGVEVVTVRDRNGEIIQRFRRMPDGQIEVLIGEVEGPGGPGFQHGPRFPQQPRFRPGPGIPPVGGDGGYDYGRYLPPLEVPIPEDDYIVESRRASPHQIEEALVAPPVEEVERPYSLEEIRRSERLRSKVRRIDIDTITFDFGSANVGEDQVPSLQAIGEALQRVIARDPREVYLIEGHTDAVGSDLSNLALSDRRAESVAEILTNYFQIPPENLITQGYGEAYLKIPTQSEERQNRRVTMRRITPLLQTGEYQPR